jgi:hypothetical protein
MLSKHKANMAGGKGVQETSQSRANSAQANKYASDAARGTQKPSYAEPEPAEVTGKDGVYAEGKKKQLSGEFEGGPNEMTLKTGGVYAESYKGEPKSTKKALTPGEFDSEQDDEPAELTGPSGVTGGANHGEMPAALKKRAQQVKEQGHFAEEHGEDELSDEHGERFPIGGKEAQHWQKGPGGSESGSMARGGGGAAANSRQTPSVPQSTQKTDRIPSKPAAKPRKGEPQRKMGPGGGYYSEDASEYNYEEGLEAEAGIPKSKKDQLSGEYEGGVAEETGPSGVSTGYAEHDEDDNPYTRTGFGSTYKEDEEDCGMKGKGKKAMAPEFAEFMEELEALKAENARIKHEYREAKIARRRDQIHSFVEGLYESGKMVDSIIPERKLMEFAEGLEFGVMEFSEGETATSLLFGILDRLPNLVDFSEYAGGSMKFVDEVDLDPHQKALAMVENSGGEMDYVEALKKAMFT